MISRFIFSPTPAKRGTQIQQTIKHDFQNFIQTYQMCLLADVSKPGDFGFVYDAIVIDAAHQPISLHLVCHYVKMLSLAIERSLPRLRPASTYMNYE